MWGSDGPLRLLPVWRVLGRRYASPTRPPSRRGASFKRFPEWFQDFKPLNNTRNFFTCGGVLAYYGGWRISRILYFLRVFGNHLQFDSVTLNWTLVQAEDFSKRTHLNEDRNRTRLWSFFWLKVNQSATADSVKRQACAKPFFLRGHLVNWRDLCHF